MDDLVDTDDDERVITRNVILGDQVGLLMEFFDMLVRYEVALWNAVDQVLSREGLVSLAQLHALRVIDRYAGQARVQDLSHDIGITVGRRASRWTGSNGTAWPSGAPTRPTDVRP